eukprot:TRINITY_DN122_c0_g1_i1.p1 TRINITY_DN122_c0_g1~~TRINITY_DN122_c0_g1_i1.p1  ORF type:complete len:717 (-),score=148.77 TRINITY_DN122_c0_g1_i1:637-2787(-)
MREAMKMKGMRMMVYWIVNYIFFYSLFLVLMVFLIIAGVVLQFRFFTINDFFVYFILFLLWGHVLVAMSFFASVFFSRAQSATVVGYFFIIATALIALNLVSDIINDIGNVQAALYIVTLFPPFTLYRGLLYLSLEIFMDGPGLKMADIWDKDLNMGSVYLYLIFQWAALLIAMLYLEEVWPSEFGVKRHPLFFLNPIKRFGLFLYHKIRGTDSEKTISVISDAEDDYDDDGDEDDHNGEKSEFGVKEEIQLAEGNSEPWALRVCHVRKSFQPWSLRIPGKSWCRKVATEKNAPKWVHRIIGKPQKPMVAVSDVSFVVRQGECVGILGPNGAGKTTLFSCLSGLFQSTSGQADIFGVNINAHTRKAHMVMGMCPQHDILWENMTAAEHMKFFGFLKNIPRKPLKREIRRGLKAVELWKVRKQKVKTFSGGMKRRLSVALALVGSPDIIFLDEPSTGLDPASRRQLWDVIASQKSKAAIVLTTHSMEEAEALCDRLVIMARGKILAVGSAQELKARYGEGWKLTLQSDVPLAKLTKFVETKLVSDRRDVKLLHNLAGTREYVLKGVESLQRVFAEMAKNKDKYNIADWGLANTSLEEVFHSIVVRDLNEETVIKPSGDSAESTENFESEEDERDYGNGVEEEESSDDEKEESNGKQKEESSDDEKEESSEDEKEESSDDEKESSDDEKEESSDDEKESHSSTDESDDVNSLASTSED